MGGEDARTQSQSMGATCLGLVMRKWLPPPPAALYNQAILGSLSLCIQFNSELFSLILSFEFLYKLQHLVMIVFLSQEGKD